MSVTNDIRLVKRTIRDEVKSRRLAVSEEEKQRLDLKIANRFLNLWCYRECALLLAFVSNRYEIDTALIIQHALTHGKRVAVPRCVKEAPEIDFYSIKSMNDLEPGSYGIPEPSLEKCEKTDEFSEGLCIVPALAFDRNGYRLGFGKGYYDRFLMRFQEKTVGICYDDDIFDNLPHGKYDRKVNLTVTQSRILYSDKTSPTRDRL